jgi:hypothetical protein
MGELWRWKGHRTRSDRSQEHTAPRRLCPRAHRSWGRSPRNGVLLGTVRSWEYSPGSSLLLGYLYVL